MRRSMAPGKGQENKGTQHNRNEKAFFPSSPEHGQSYPRPDRMTKLLREESQEQATYCQWQNRGVEAIAHGIVVKFEAGRMENHGGEDQQAHDPRNRRFAQRADQHQIASHLQKLDRDAKRKAAPMNESDKQRIGWWPGKCGPAIG